MFWRKVTGLLTCVMIAASLNSLTRCAQATILGQRSALLGEPAGAPWQSLVMPESMFDRRVSPAGHESPQQQNVSSYPGAEEAANLKSKWSSPYTMTSGPMLREESEGWYEFLPEGCLPNGPRTPKEHRHLGIFFPLEGTSWLNRPLSAGWGVGALWGDDPLDNRIDLEPGIYGIYRFGWDYDYYWGLEARLGQATSAVEDNIVGTPSTTADITLFDVSMLWYPTGDSRVRPYVCFGLGFQHFNFRDHNFDVVNTTTFSLPIGIGVKWMYTPWIVLRLEASHNWAMGNDQLDMMHNGALTGGVEVRFGGTRPSYWPWNPNRKIW